MPVSLAVTGDRIQRQKPIKNPSLNSRADADITISDVGDTPLAETVGMPHRYKVREIAQQSGLSEATVDRVLNERPGVRENTRAEVMQAIADLDKQRAQLRLNGRRYLIDVVMQTPQRFSDAFRAAVEAELPAFAPAMLRARFHLWESGSTAQMVDALGRTSRQPRRGAQGAGRTRWWPRRSTASSRPACRS